MVNLNPVSAASRTVAFVATIVLTTQCFSVRFIYEQLAELGGTSVNSEGQPPITHDGQIIKEVSYPDSNVMNINENSQLTKGHEPNLGVSSPVPPATEISSPDFPATPVASPEGSPDLNKDTDEWPSVKTELTPTKIKGTIFSNDQDMQTPYEGIEVKNIDDDALLQDWIMSEYFTDLDFDTGYYQTAIDKIREKLSAAYEDPVGTLSVMKQAYTDAIDDVLLAEQNGTPTSGVTWLHVQLVVAPFMLVGAFYILGATSIFILKQVVRQLGVAKKCILLISKNSHPIVSCVLDLFLLYPFRLANLILSAALRIPKCVGNCIALVVTTVLWAPVKVLLKIKNLFTKTRGDVRQVDAKSEEPKKNEPNQEQYVDTKSEQPDKVEQLEQPNNPSNSNQEQYVDTKSEQPNKVEQPEKPKNPSNSNEVQKIDTDTPKPDDQVSGNQKTDDLEWDDSNVISENREMMDDVSDIEIEYDPNYNYLAVAYGDDEPPKNPFNPNNDKDEETQTADILNYLFSDKCSCTIATQTGELDEETQKRHDGIREEYCRKAEEYRQQQIARQEKNHYMMGLVQIAIKYVVETPELRRELARYEKNYVPLIQKTTTTN